MKRFHYIQALLIFGVGSLVASCSDSNNEPEPVNTVKVTEVSLTGVSDSGISLGSPGDTRTVSAVFSPADADNIDYFYAAYRSSDTRVFTVSENGVLTVVGRGTAYLTVYAPYETNVSADYKVTVDGRPLQSITVDLSGINLDVTASTFTSYSYNFYSRTTFSPDHGDVDNSKVLWTSSNTDAFVVNPRGVVEAVWGGTSTIRVYAIDAPQVYDEFEMHCTYSDWVSYDMSGWAIESSGTGSGYGGGDAENLLIGEGIHLIKPGQEGGPPAGEDMYIIIDALAVTPINYFTLSHTWIDGVAVNNNFRISNPVFHGSNDGVNFEHIQNFTINAGSYDWNLEFDDTVSYRYYKVVFGYPSTVSNGATCVIFRNFNLGLKTIYD